MCTIFLQYCILVLQENIIIRSKNIFTIILFKYLITQKTPGLVIEAAVGPALIKGVGYVWTLIISNIFTVVGMY